MWGELISGGLKLLGGFLDRDHAQAQADNNFNRNAALQREFAQNGIRWKVEDAKAAGIHPLYALGGSTASASPVAVGDVPGIGSSLASMGQDVGRAINATRTPDEREGAFNDTVRKLTLTKMGLENDLLASQIKRLQAQANPAPPAADQAALVDGQGSVVVPKADKFEDRPRLAVAGREWETSPGWSNAEDFEKRYGDEGPGSWYFNTRILWDDYKRNALSDRTFERNAKALTGAPAPQWASRYYKRARRAVHGW